MSMLLLPTRLWRCHRFWSLACKMTRRTLVYKQPVAAAGTATAVRAEASSRRGGIWRTDDSWPGLAAWRGAAVDERTSWGQGDKGPVVEASEVQPEEEGGPPHANACALGGSLAQCARQVLMTAGESRYCREPL
jgi:hypothetical protein